MVPDRPLDDAKGDLFIAGSNLNQAMHGDRVVARIERISDDRAEGRIVRILERGAASVVGRFDIDGSGLGFVVPFDRRLIMDVQIPSDERGEAKPGDMVVVEITRWPTPTRGSARPGHRSTRRHRRARRRQRNHHSEVRHSRRAQPRGGRRGAPHRRGCSREGHRGRTDFRPLTIVTIDGEHARDFDDAISIEVLAERTLLARRPYRRRRALRAGGDGARRRSVRARDVGVLPGSRRPHVSIGAVDRPLQPQSQRRSPGAVVPDGSRSSRHCGPIRASRRRDPQPGADDVYGGERDSHQSRSGDDSRSISELVPLFERMRELFEILNKRRHRRGSIDFDLKEPEIVLDDEGMVEAIVAAERNIAHRIIEEFMLLANETVAQHLDDHDVPTLFRIHEEPDPLEGRGVRGVRFDARLQSRRAPQRRETAAFPETRRENARDARGKADCFPDAADDAEGSLRRAEQRALRSRRKELHAFHVADPPLSRPRGASHTPRVASRCDEYRSQRTNWSRIFPRLPGTRPSASAAPTMPSGNWCSGRRSDSWPTRSATSSRATSPA